MAEVSETLLGAVTACTTDAAPGPGVREDKRQGDSRCCSSLEDPWTARRRALLALDGTKSDPLAGAGSASSFAEEAVDAENSDDRRHACHWLVLLTTCRRAFGFER